MDEMKPAHKTIMTSKDFILLAMRDTVPLTRENIFQAACELSWRSKVLSVISRPGIYLCNKERGYGGDANRTHLACLRIQDRKVIKSLFDQMLERGEIVLPYAD